MSESSSTSGAFLRLISLTKEKFNLVTPSEVTARSIPGVTDLSSVCHMSIENPKLNNSDLPMIMNRSTKLTSHISVCTPSESALSYLLDNRSVKELADNTAKRLDAQAEVAYADMEKHLQEYDKENVTKKAVESNLTSEEVEMKAVIEKQIRDYGQAVAFEKDRHDAPWSPAAEQYWKQAKYDLAYETLVTSDFPMVSWSIKATKYPPGNVLEDDILRQYFKVRPTISASRLTELEKLLAKALRECMASYSGDDEIAIMYKFMNSMNLAERRILYKQFVNKYINPNVFTHIPEVPHTLSMVRSFTETYIEMYETFYKEIFPS